MAKSETETAPVNPAMTPEQFQQFLAAMVGQNASLAQSVAAVAESLQKQRPENVSHPDISAYNPLGERDHPRMALPCPEVYFGGFPIEADQVDVVEAVLINLLQPGEVYVTRVDGDTEKVPIGFKRGETDQLERITIQIRTGKEHRNAWPGQREVLSEIVSKQGLDVLPLPRRGDRDSTIAWLQKTSALLRTPVAA